jgi:hypothetical protein
MKRENQAYIVYLLFGLLICGAPFLKIAVPISYTDWNIAFYDVIEDTPEDGWIIMDGFGYEQFIEMKGASLAFIQHVLFDKNLKLVIAPIGVGHNQEMLEVYAQMLFQEVLGHDLADDPIYGTQVVLLAYNPIPYESGWTSLAGDIYGTSAVDYQGTPLSSLPMFQGSDAIQTALDADVIIPSPYSITIALTLFPDIPKLFILGSGSISIYMPDWQAGIIQGFIGGMRGGAEYEAMTGYYGKSTAQMLQNLFVAIVVVAGVAFSFVTYWVKPRKED